MGANPTCYSRLKNSKLQEIEAYLNFTQVSFLIHTDKFLYVVIRPSDGTYNYLTLFSGKKDNLKGYQTTAHVMLYCNV